MPLVPALSERPLGGGRAKIENSSRRHPRKLGQKRFLVLREVLARKWGGLFWATSFGKNYWRRDRDHLVPSRRMDAAVCRAEVCYPFGRYHGRHRVVKRRDFITLLGGAAAWPLAARAQTKQTRRIGVLMGLVANDPEAKSRVVAFENGLRELGWVKERNLSIEYRWAGDGNVLRDHAAQLLAMAPDLILANSTPVTVALREQNLAVPIVFTQVVDPVGQGLVLNLAHPGGNLTGFRRVLCPLV